MKALINSIRMHAFFCSALLCALILIAPTWSRAQEHTSDANTLLLLHFNSSLSGASGETPTQASGVTYQAGIFGNAASFNTGNQVYYASANNLNSALGTLEFWIKPAWSGNDGGDHYALRFGDGGGLLFGKDGGNYWRSILNRYGVGNPEVGTGFNVASEWSINQWHHAAFTWAGDSLKLYIDGALRATEKIAVALNAVTESAFQLGADNASAYLNATLDELRISNIERTTREIQTSYLNGVSTVSSLTMSPNQFNMYVTWSSTPALTAVTNLGAITIPNWAVTWTSSSAAVASVDANGTITANAAGAATITATYKGSQAQATVTVKAPVLQPTVESIDSRLATPATGYLHKIPVVVIRYLPTNDGVNIDPVVADWVGTIAAMKTKLLQESVDAKFMLEEGSRFRGYKTPTAQPALGYQVVHIVTVYEELPPGKPTGGPGEYFPDYNQILTRFGAQNFVEAQGVKEFWVWGYHHGNIAPVESNMSSPTTGDISNSYRFNDDMPIYSKTYTLYNYNFTRSQNEAVHNHGHQLESILAHVNQLQDGNTTLFWNQFATYGRCGNTHFPPNTTVEYGYNDMTLASSDIEDWRPDNLGAKKNVNANTWGNLVYAWPNGAPADANAKTEAQWYIYWMQNMPGIANGIPNGANQMTNWWEFTANWDAAIQSNLGLHGMPPVIATPTSLAAANANSTTINLSWTDNSGNEVGFKIERKTGASGTYAEIARVAANVRSYSNTGLTTGTTYYYRVRAYTSHGNSSYSNEASGTPSAGVPPSAPSNLTATVASATQINLSWTDNSNNETGFKIERRTPQSWAYAQIAAVGANVTSYANTGLTSGTTYYYRVRAYNNSGHSVYSNEASATNLAFNKPATASSMVSSTYGPSKAVDGSTGTYWASARITSGNKAQWLQVDLQTAKTVSRVVVRWRTTLYAKNYQVWLSSDNVNWTTVHTDNLGNGGADDITFPAKTARYVRLNMTLNNGNNYCVDELEVYAGATAPLPKAEGEAGAPETLIPTTIALQQNYPNPFNPQTTLAYSIPANMHIVLKVYNLAGQEVATLFEGYRDAGTYQATFEASHLSSGAYFAVMKAGTTTQVRRMTLMK